MLPLLLVTFLMTNACLPADLCLASPPGCSAIQQL